MDYTVTDHALDALAKRKILLGWNEPLAIRSVSNWMLPTHSLGASVGCDTGVWQSCAPRDRQ